MDRRSLELQIRAAKRTPCGQASMMLRLMKRNSLWSNLGLSRENNSEIYQRRVTDRWQLRFPESVTYCPATAVSQIGLFRIYYTDYIR